MDNFEVLWKLYQMGLWSAISIRGISRQTCFGVDASFIIIPDGKGSRDPLLGGGNLVYRSEMESDKSES